MKNENITVMSSDYSRAVKLNKHIKIHAELAQQSLYEMCKGLKEMRDDKLYKELDYQNFEEYCVNEVGLKSSQAYNFISVAENLSENFVQSIGQIGTTKLALLAKLDEPQREEIVQNVDLNNTSVKKLKEEIASLKSEISSKDDDIRNLETNYENLEKRHIELGHENMKLSATLRESQDTQKNLVGQIENLEDTIAEAGRKQCELEQDKDELAEELAESREKIEDLEETIQELESRPVEVAVADNSEEIQKLRDDNLREIFRMGKAHSDEIRKIKTDYEQKISEMQENQADKPDVRAEINAYQKVAEDSLHNLYAAICCQNEYGYGRLTISVVEMLKEWMERFNKLDDEEN